MDNKKVLDLVQITTAGDWTLWKFIVEPRSHRYCWTLKGRFPTFLFDATAILYLLDKTEELAMSEMDMLKASGQFIGQ